MNARPRRHWCFRGDIMQPTAKISLIDSAQLPSRFGDFRIYGFLEHGNGKEHTAIVRGDIKGFGDIPTRVHSECHTGDVLGSLRCDCRDQLEAALAYIGKQERGLVIYLKQEGRDIGLLNKIKAYHLQDQGLDTVDANTHLGLPVDGRSYDIAAEILRLLEVESIQLMSNNPLKFKGLEEEGVTITRRIPIVIKAVEQNRGYLSTKQIRMGHIFSENDSIQHIQIQA